MRKIFWLVGLVILPIDQSFGQVKITIQKQEATDQICCFRADGIPENLLNEWKNSGQASDWWKQHFKVGISGSSQSMLGEYQMGDNHVLFIPRFPLDQGATYWATLGQKQMSFEITWTSALTKLLKSSPAGVIPSNTLRMYLYFSAPMGLENPYEFIELINKGQLIEDAFVEVKEGLWNDNRTRLTLFFHPGRIKQGVGPNVTQGSVLEEGKNYLIKISPNWRDQNGRPLGNHTVIPLEVGHRHDTRINPESWIPSAKGAEISIETNRILDEEIVPGKISVTKDGRKIKGNWSVKSTRLIFTSFQTLSAGYYRLSILPTLEDVSGNTVLNAFDSGISRRNVTDEPVLIDFEVE